MSKRLQDYVKYTIKELDTYTRTEGSCVRKVNTKFHLSLGAYALGDFKQALQKHLRHKKVGYYDQNLNGIILDLKNIKVLGNQAALRADDSRLHIDINADCYVFQPAAGAVLSGLVKHIGKHHVGVIIYRVFNAHIRFAHKICEDDVQLEQEVKFKIKNFNLQNILPYIEGELLMEQNSAEGETLKNSKTSKKSGKITKFTTDANDNTLDSGIEEREAETELTELDELISLIKQEQTDAEVEDVTGSPLKVDLVEETSKKSKKSKKEKRKRKSSESSETIIPVRKIKQEIKQEVEV